MSSSSLLLLAEFQGPLEPVSAWSALQEACTIGISPSEVPVAVDKQERRPKLLELTFETHFAPTKSRFPCISRAALVFYKTQTSAQLEYEG